MKNYRSIYYYLFILCFFSCRFSDTRLQVYNESQTVISISFSSPYSNELLNSIYVNLEDTICINQKKVFKKPSGCSQNSWSLDIQKSKDKKLKLFVFNIDTLVKYKNKYNINQIVKLKLLDTVLTYSEDELTKMDWKIHYKGRMIK